MSDQTTAMEIPAGDPRAVELTFAVRGGDIDTIRRLLAEDPRLARAGLVDRKGGFRTLLHLVADWPGYFPNGLQIVRLLIQAGHAEYAALDLRQCLVSVDCAAHPYIQAMKQAHIVWV